MNTIFLITVTPATYQGTRVVTNTNTGTVTNQDGNTSPYNGASSTAVPYSFEYGKFMLTVQTIGEDGKPSMRRRFQQNGIYRTMYGIPVGRRRRHPTKLLLKTRYYKMDSLRRFGRSSSER